jgi:heparinase II/III-like protein
MSWEELRTRAGQEVSKRVDVALYMSGRQPGRDGLRGKDNPPGKFFFAADELPARVSLLREHLPHEAEALVEEADEICRHRFRLLGFENLDYGAEIDWHLDAVHGKRTPLIPWFKIDFLDFAQAGDHKVTWELNRHQHLVTLAKAWLLSRQDKYAHEAIAQWYSWQRANPYPLGVNWASSLEVAFRSLSWLWLRHLLASCPILSASFGKDLLRAQALNGRHIHQYLSTYFSPNTHLLGEAVALFFIGTLSPEISAAGKWKEQGWRIIQQEAQRQVQPDGVYFEQSLYYHVYALDLLLHARLLASRNGVESPAGFDDILGKMLGAVRALAQVGPPDGFGDDDGGRVFNPRRNRAEHMTDPLAIGATLFHSEGSRSNAALTEEAIWLFGADAIHWTAKSSDMIDGPKVYSFKNGGVYIAASHEPSQQMVIDAGPQGTGRSGHGHADALSIKVSFGKRPWLVDAGTFGYITPGGERQIFRGTRAHNTLAVDGLDQAHPEGPFAWSAIPAVHAECWIPGASFTLFAGSHSGYERLAQPVRHRRFVFHLDGAFWLVRDVVEGRGSHLLETSWHFAPDLVASKAENSFRIAPSQKNPSSPVPPGHLTLLPLSDPQWKSEIVSEHVSPAYGAMIPAPVLRCSARVSVPAVHAMLLLPAVGGNLKTGRFVSVNEQPAAAQKPDAVYQYDDADGDDSHRMVFGRSPSTTWTFGPWTSDAKFLYYRVRDRQVRHLIFCEGSFVQFQGKPLFSKDRPLQWLDWANRRGTPSLACSDESLAASFATDALTLSTLR